MPSDDTQQSPPKDVGHVPVEVVGVDDVARGQDPSQPPAGPGSTVLAAASFVLFPVALWVLSTPELAGETFIRAAALQSLALWAIIVVVFFVPCLGTIAAIAGVVVAFLSAVRAWRGEYVKLPIIWLLVRRYM